ncbi:MAG TPA: polyphosphate kinase 2 family protein [Gaiellaceae bacterium]|nr:polyphosphate kinase 2 family protein [Gaiellaceae bacterium]
MAKKLRVEPGSKPRLDERDPGDRSGLGDKAEGKERLAKLVEELSVLHNRLYAEAKRSVLLVLQGLDASGKDGTIRSVLTGVNPQGCRIVSFKQPTSVDLAHDYLWRIHLETPSRGEIGIFNRSHYEDVVAVRVHELAPKEVWSRRPHQIREFERMLVDEGTTIVKVFLHVSREEQGERLRDRLENPEKAWKFRRGDLDDRARWDEFMKAYEEVIGETSTDWAPWYVVPADHNWVRNVHVATLLVEALRTIDPQLPQADASLADITIE